MAFSTDKQKFPLETVVGGTVHKICIQRAFRCTNAILLWNWAKICLRN